MSVKTNTAARLLEVRVRRPVGMEGTSEDEERRIKQLEEAYSGFDDWLAQNPLPIKESESEKKE